MPEAYCDQTLEETEMIVIFCYTSGEVCAKMVVDEDDLLCQILHAVAMAKEEGWSGPLYEVLHPALEDKTLDGLDKLASVAKSCNTTMFTIVCTPREFPERQEGQCEVM